VNARSVKTGTLSVAIAALLASAPRLAGQQGAPDPAASLRLPLTATAHPPLPNNPFELWLAPTDAARRSSPALTAFSTGVRLHAAARYTDALPLLGASLAGTPLDDYALYYRGLNQLRLSRLDEAQQTFAALLGRPLSGYLTEGARLRAAEVAEAKGDAQTAASYYDQLSRAKTLEPQDVLMRLGRARRALGDVDAAALAFARVYYEFPLSDEATLAEAVLTEMNAWKSLDSGSARYALELGRAERLFGARRYAQARTAFELLQPVAPDDDAELVTLRLAESDHYLKRYRTAREALAPFATKASRQAEAQFFYLTATRELGLQDEYVSLARGLVAQFPESSWAEETLNNLATHYILVDDDAEADTVFRELYQRFPGGRHAQRAAWKIGWWAYRNGRYEECADVFERAAASFPRSDFRPSWLYWSARSRDKLKDTRTSATRYGIIVADYVNSYYGRLAIRQLEARRIDPLTAAASVAAPAGQDATPAGRVDAALPPTDRLIRTLIAYELHDDAMNELQWAQRAYGDSSAIQATIGLVYSRRGDLRRGINAMKRAYPQYLAVGGDDLPPDMLKVLFPLDYWDLIRRHSAEHGLDPYLIAALMAQESTFDPDIKSVANAVGLMQVLPSTGRRYARRIGIRRFSPSMLTNPQINVRLGTAIFSDLVERNGGVHLALASYNAGENAVARWRAERPGIERDEFIDDIPYPETQNYVKRILGTAEDYRRLYGQLGATPGVARTGAGGSSSPPAKASSSAAPGAKKKAPPKKKSSTRQR
jgi:soluble lytic murein transglycosylase